MPAKSLEKEPHTDGSPVCKCTKETFGCSTHPVTQDEWAALQRDSLVRILALQEKAKALQESEAASSRKFSGQLMLFGPDSYSSKIAHKSAPEGGMWSLGSWWRVDTPGATESLQRLMLVPRTGGIDGSALLPTPTVCGSYNRKGASKTSGDGLATYVKMWPTPVASDTSNRKPPQNFCLTKTGSVKLIGRTGTLSQVRLSQVVKMWPTPCASASKGSSPAALTRRDGQSRANDRIDHAVMASDGGQLNPVFVEWLMGWPLGWTEVVGKSSRTLVEPPLDALTEGKESKPSATAKSRSRRRSRG